MRVVNVDLDPDALYSRGISPEEVTNAILTQNIIESAGTVKMGSVEYDVAMNSSPEVLADLNSIPLRYANGAMVYVRDVAFVHDGYSPQTNLVRRDGRPSALLPILTSGSASTLTVVENVRKLMPRIQAGLPKSLNVDFLFDQSVFVRSSINGVVREGVIAACLTGLMILMFLRSWRSTVIVATSIPLSILASVARADLRRTRDEHHDAWRPCAGGWVRWMMRRSRSRTTTVTLSWARRLRQAILDAAAEVATPAFVATLSICIVFVPIPVPRWCACYRFFTAALGRGLRDARQPISFHGRSCRRWFCSFWPPR